MRFLNIMITPKGECITEIGDTPYFHSVFFILEETERSKNIDMELPNGDYLHSKNTRNGQFFLIEREIK